MSNLSRRSLVTSAAALPALAVPAVAQSAPLPGEPIFAAIETYVRSEEAITNTSHEYSQAEGAFRDEFGSLSPDAFPKGLREELTKIIPGFKYAVTNSHEAIDRAATVLDNDHHILAGLHRELDRQTAAYNARVRPADEANEAAINEYDNARDQLLSTVPTTQVGLVLLLEIVRDRQLLFDNIVHNNGEAEQLIKTLATAAKKLAA